MKPPRDLRTYRASRLLLGAAAALACVQMPLARAQAFTEVQSALVDYARADLLPRKDCAAMAQFRRADIAALHAESVPATDATPGYCHVTGTLAPEIAFEVSLPARWNGRFYMIGNGGHAGDGLDDPGRVVQRNGALKLGFAFAQTNTGHDARKEPGASFVLSNPQKAIDYAYRAVHLTATTAKAITASYYAKPVAHAYWNSCSNGGRQGLIEAQRYPKDFDGVYANAPWVDQTGFTIGALWNHKAMTAAPLTAAKLALLANAVMAKCDALDGLKDGLIDDPRRCDFDARRDVAACPAGTDTDACLTASQADAVMKVYRGPQGQGKSLFPGYMPGSEALVTAGPAGNPPTSAWLNLIVPGQPDRKPADFNLAEGTMRYLVHTPPKPDYDWQSFNFDTDPPLLEAWGRKVNAKSTDLSRFRSRGGKILMSYGWADQVLQPLAGVNYYEQAVARNGADTPAFFRLFMVPWMTHCAGGVGPDQFDPMTALINWVEKDTAPATLRAAKIVDKAVVRTLPLCPYPAVARYSGTGSTDDAANFSCVKP
jgi:feruloyl esterase